MVTTTVRFTDGVMRALKIAAVNQKTSVQQLLTDAACDRLGIDTVTGEPLASASAANSKRKSARLPAA